MAMELGAIREVRRPVDEVFAFFSDASNNPLWQRGMVSCRWITEPPVRIDSRYQQKARFLGRDVDSTFVVTAIDPGRSITIETIESTFPIKVTRSVEPTGEESCRITTRISGGPEGVVMKVLGPLVRGRAQRSVDGDYDRLVELLETSLSR